MASNNGEPSAQRSIEELEEGWESEGLDPTQATKQHRDLYLKMRLRKYDKSNLQDLDLWDQYREDFASWTSRHFQTANNRHTRSLRILLRSHGVLVG